MSNSGLEALQVIILGLVAIALLANVGIIVILFVSMGKLVRAMKDEMADFRASVMPMIYDTRELMTSMSPKMQAIADDVSVILHGVRSQSAAFESVGTDVATGLRRQAARLEELLSGLIDTADRTGNVIAGTVGRPIRQLAGLLASARAVVDMLRAPHRTIHATREPDNRDMFV